MCAKGQSMSESGRKFHATWCVAVAAPTGECASASRASKPASTPTSAPKHDCEAVHAGVGHVRFAIREGKRGLAAPVCTPAAAAAKPASKRAQRRQAQANAAGLAANAHAAAEVKPTPPVSKPVVTSGPSRDEPTPVRVPGTPDVLAAAEAILAHESERVIETERMWDAIQQIALRLGVSLGAVEVAR